MKIVIAIIQPARADQVIDALQTVAGVGGITAIDVRGYGRRASSDHLGEVPAGGAVHHLPRVLLEIAVSDAVTPQVVATIEREARTGRLGDGKIFVVPLEEAVRVRTGERGDGAL